MCANESETKVFPPMMSPEEVWHWLNEKGEHQLGVKVVDDRNHEVEHTRSTCEHPKCYHHQSRHFLMRDRYVSDKFAWIPEYRLTRYLGDNAK
jgi:hypothetical protein